jgi:hypothetical protein
VALPPHPIGSRYRRLADPAGPTDIERAALDFRFRAPNPAPLVHPGFQTPQTFKRPLSCCPRHPTTIIQRLPTGPTHIEPDIRCRAPKRPPWRISGSSSPSPSISPSSATNLAPQPSCSGNSRVPPRSSPRGTIFGFARQTGPPLCISGFRPPWPAASSSAASHNPQLAIAEGFP